MELAWAWGAAAFLVPLAIAIALAWRWLRAQVRRPRRLRKLRFPVVLAHGILGFDELKVGKVRREYFKGIPDRLRRLGAEVHVVRVPMTAPVEERAAALARAVRRLDADKVNIIAHSMGGLDARYAISRLGIAAQVASLTTIGTPHRGTPLADIGTRLIGEGLMLRKVLEKLGLDVGAFYDLTTARMLEFNEQNPDVAKVAYASYVARAGAGVALNPILLPAHLYLRERAGDNDGLVPADSQRWGDVLGTVEADHWAQIGWSTRFDAREFYASVVKELIAKGF